MNPFPVSRLPGPLLVLGLGVVASLLGGWMLSAGASTMLREGLNPTPNVLAAPLPDAGDAWVLLGEADFPSGAYEVWDEYRDGYEGEIPVADYRLRLLGDAGEVRVDRSGGARTVRSRGLSRAQRARHRGDFTLESPAHLRAEVTVARAPVGTAPYVALYPYVGGAAAGLRFFAGAGCLCLGLLLGTLGLLWLAAVCWSWGRGPPAPVTPPSGPP